MRRPRLVLERIFERHGTTAAHTVGNLQDDLRRQEEYGHELDPNNPDKKTEENPNRLGGMRQLRRCLRRAHGYKPNDLLDDNSNITKHNGDKTPLARLLNGETAYLSREKSDTEFHFEKKGGTRYLELDGKKVVDAQKKVQTWTERLSEKELSDILGLKAGKKEIGLSDSWKNAGGLSAYKKYLTLQSEKIVMRSTIFMTHKPTGELLDNPREHIVYHACYPELKDDTLSQQYFADGSNGSAKIKDEAKDKLKDAYKSIILRQLKVASANGEDIDLQAPNAFLYGLAPKEQAKAKTLFQQAVYEAAREAKANPAIYGGLKAIYIHDAAAIPDDVKDFVFLNTGDAFAPDRISHEKGGRRVAVCIMSDGIGPVGNGALGDRANHAMEENTARLCAGTFEAMGPAFNMYCRDAKNRHSFNDAAPSSLEKTVQPGHVWKNGVLGKKQPSTSSAAPTPAEVGKIIGEGSQYKFSLDNEFKAKTTENPEGLSGMDQLRRWLRTAHGVGHLVTTTNNIVRKTAGSPLDDLLKGKTIYMWREKSETKFSTQKPIRNDVLELDGQKVVQAQKDVQTWRNGLTDKEVGDILKLKAEKKVEVPGDGNLSTYERHLTERSQKLVMRSTTFMTHTPEGELLDKPREHIVYHASYPELRRNTESQAKFTSGKSGNAVLKPGKKNELKDTYKSIILQQLKVASDNGEDIDLQAPNAFLYGLARREQPEAKKLFRKAVYEAAREAKANPAIYGGLKAIYIHDAAGEIPGDVKDMVINNKGDAFAPDRVGQERGGRRVAVCIMSDGIGPVGNIALGDEARKAMEENTARLCAGTFEAMGPAFNDHCYKNMRDL